jgi:hypothetical protein
VVPSYRGVRWLCERLQAIHTGGQLPVARGSSHRWGPELVLIVLYGGRGGYFWRPSFSVAQRVADT